MRRPWHKRLAARPTQGSSPSAANGSQTPIGNRHYPASWQRMIEAPRVGGPWGGNRERAVQHWAVEILAEARAILEGRVLERTEWESGDVAWALLNRLSHGAWSDLAALAGADGCGSGWLGALSYLASEVCAMAGSPLGLRLLQSSRLVPLELDALTDPRMTIYTPLDFISQVRSALSRPCRPVPTGVATQDNPQT